MACGNLRTKPRAPISKKIWYVKNFSTLNGWEHVNLSQTLQKVEIKLIVSLRWVKGVSVERQLCYVIFFFSVRMKNLQTEVKHKPCNSYFSFIHCSAFWPTLQARNNKKQKPNSKMQNSWLTMQTITKNVWKQKHFPLNGESSDWLKCCGIFFLKPCFPVCSYFSR